MDPTPDSPSASAPSSPPQRRWKRGVVGLLFVASVAAYLGVHQAHRSEPLPTPSASAPATYPNTGVQSLAWVEERIKQWGASESETLPQATLWETHARVAIEKARKHHRLIFLVATHGDVVSGRI